MSAEKDTTPAFEIFTLKSNREATVETRRNAAEDADNKLFKRDGDNGGNTKSNK